MRAKGLSREIVWVKLRERKGEGWKESERVCNFVLEENILVTFSSWNTRSGHREKDTFKRLQFRIECPCNQFCHQLWQFCTLSLSPNTWRGRIWMSFSLFVLSRCSCCIYWWPIPVLLPSWLVVTSIHFTCCNSLQLDISRLIFGVNISLDESNSPAENSNYYSLQRLNTNHEHEISAFFSLFLFFLLLTLITHLHTNQKAP